MHIHSFATLICLFCHLPLLGAEWIAHPSPPYKDYNVQYFRKKFHLDQPPQQLNIQVSADNRYQLFLNGHRVGEGPARSRFSSWCLDKHNLAPFLQQGENILAVIVWNYGTAAGQWQLSQQTALLILADQEESPLNTSSQNWLCLHNKAYQPTLIKWPKLPYFYAAGPGEYYDSKLDPIGWNEIPFDDSAWQSAAAIGNFNVLQLHDWLITPWMLQPREVSMLERGRARHPVRIARANSPIPINPLLSGQAVTIPPRTHLTFLLDQGEIITAFPELQIEGGKDAVIQLTYVESLAHVEEKKMEEAEERIFEKGNRNDVAGKVVVGLQDILIADGQKRSYSPLYWRCWRYVEFDIQTKEEPLTLHHFYGSDYTYPLKLEARFQADQPLLNEIWETGWRTTRLCCNETLFDCPYYEQMNYSADARIEALVCYLHTRETALVKRSIDLLFDTLGASGLTEARSPSQTPQYIPTWSLDNIHLLHDLWMWRGEESYIQAKLPLTRILLNWFLQRIDKETGILKPLEWKEGQSLEPAAWNGPAERISLELLLALKSAEALEGQLGSQETSRIYQTSADSLHKALANYWPTRKPVDDPYLEQVMEVYAILADIIPPEKQRELLQQRLTNPLPLINNSFFATYYWLYYFHEALYKTGLANEWLSTLYPWKEMLEEGLTTWAESYPPTRSDCHGWSCSPSIHLFTTLCGIRPAAPGFKKVSIRPSVGSCQQIEASIPHPNGRVAIQIQCKEKSEPKISVNLPKGVEKM